MTEVRAVSVSNLFNRKYKLLPFTGEWQDAFGNPSATGAWFISGLSGNGKTSFAQQLARHFDDMQKRVAYLSMEEATDHTMQQSAIQAGWREKGGRIKILEPASPDDIDNWLEGHKKPEILIVDTVQYWVQMYRFTYRKYREMKERHSNKLFVYVSHVKGNEPDGSVAIKIMRDASLKIYCQGYRAISKGRYIGPKGYFSIWPEKEKEIWIDK